MNFNSSFNLNIFVFQYFIIDVLILRSLTEYYYYY